MSKSGLSEIQTIDGYYNYDHLIKPLATQLTYFIPDYDICLVIAKYYLQMRPYDSVKNDREFYMSRIWEAKNTESIGTLSPLKMRLHLWNPDYIEWRESAKTQRDIKNRKLWKFKTKTIEPLISPNILRYLVSPRGIREIATSNERHRYYRYWVYYWGIKNIDKEEITLKEKLDDLKYIPHDNLLHITSLNRFRERY